MIWNDILHYLVVLAVYGTWILWAGSFRWLRLARPAEFVNGAGLWLCAGALAVAAIDRSLLSLLLGQLALQNILVRVKTQGATSRIQYTGSGSKSL
jgi:hypothetical protein